MTTTDKTLDIREALLANHGRTVKFKGRKYLVDCYESARGHFFCQVKLLQPKTQEQEKYCWWDVWNSEGHEGMELVSQLAVMGGFDA